MFNLHLVFILTNVFIVGLLFWFLTFIGRFFFISQKVKVQFDFFECGFKTLSDVNISINLAFFISALFVIIYEFELIIVVPLFFNLWVWSNTGLIFLFCTLIIILITFLLDVYFNVIHWFL